MTTIAARGAGRLAACSRSSRSARCLAAGAGRVPSDAAVGAAAWTGRRPADQRACRLGSVRRSGARVRCCACSRFTPAQQHALWRRSYARENEAVYRGWSPRGGEVAVDIYDLGPDVAHPRGEASDDPLLGLTPLPAVGLLPGWQDAVADYYRAMERGRSRADALARAVARPARDGLRRCAFTGGISTLRLMRYELAPAAAAEVAAAQTSRGAANTSTRALSRSLPSTESAVCRRRRERENGSRFRSLTR